MGEEAKKKPITLDALFGGDEPEPEEKPKRKIKVAKEEEVKVVVDTSIHDKLASRLKKSSTSSTRSNMSVTFSDVDEVQEFGEGSKLGAMTVRRRKKDEEVEIDWNQLEPSKLDAMIMRKRQGMDAEEIDWNDIEPMKMEPMVMRRIFREQPEDIDWLAMEKSKLKDMVMKKREKEIEEGIDWNEIPEKGALELEGHKMAPMTLKPRKRSVGEEMIGILSSRVMKRWMPFW